MFVRWVAILAALLLPNISAHAEPTHTSTPVGKVHRVILSYETSERGSDEFEGSSRGSYSYLERVIAVTPDGIELEYDLPDDVPAEHRARTWQFPARVFKPFRGPLQLLNRSELEPRIEAWLSAAKLPRAACGSWYFTWNAFRVECDPQSVVEVVQRITLPHQLRDGALYEDPTAREPAPLRKSIGGLQGTTWVVDMIVDPNVVRQERAKADIVVAEIRRKPMTREEAIRVRSAEQVSGTVKITFETDAAGRPYRRTRVTELKIREPSGRTETRMATETLERRQDDGRE